MTEREKLTEILNDIQQNGNDFRDVEIHGMRIPDTVSNEDVAEHLKANGVTIQKWIPVWERLPEKMCQCVCRYVFCENTDYPFFQVLWYFANLENPHFQHEGSMGMKVTHWMPIPEPPKEEP